MFPNLKIIKIIIATCHSATSDRSQSYFKLLRQVKDLIAFENIGLVKLMVMDVYKHVACYSIVEGCEYL